MTGPGHRGSMQITLIWMLHGTAGFKATSVHIGSGSGAWRAVES
jgi:hypothetical protein